jgi:cytoskeletal protein CcmA (bactofilin family)
MSTMLELSRDLGSALGPSLRFKGELIADEDLQIKGQVDGSIKHTKRLTICREGQVKADLQGQIVAIEGSVKGDVTAAVSVAMLAGSTLEGDVLAPSVSIVEGSDFNGNVYMQPAKAAAAVQAPHQRSCAPVASDAPDVAVGR